MQYLNILQMAYTFSKYLYSLSFKDRVLFNFRVFTVQLSPSKETKSLTLEELEQRIKELKKPWWNFLFHFGI